MQDGPLPLGPHPHGRELRALLRRAALVRHREARMKALRDSGLSPEKLAIVARRLRLR